MSNKVLNSLFLNEIEFHLLEEVGNIAIVDSFVKQNKLKPIGKEKPGHGEARLYVGAQSSTIGSFFNNFATKPKCFLFKNDLLEYLKDAKYEYDFKEQEYYKDIKPFWQENIDKIKSLEDDFLYFDIEEANGEEDKNRFYIRETNTRNADSYWNIIRLVALPRITKLSIFKMEKDKKYIYYFKLFLDYEFNSINHPAKIKDEESKIEGNKKITKEKRETIYQARKGQGKFREGVLQQMFACPITEVTDERLLIASHIKPWTISDEKEKIDPFNGLMLTPTYDKMFDQGFISFENDGTILISPYISPLNRKKLGLANVKKYDIKATGREKYLKYHRENIFKK